MSKYAIRGGHQYTGQDGAASGYVKEIDVDRRYYKLVMQKLQALGHQVLDVTPPEANRSLADSLNYGINMANNWGAEYFISCHVDAFETDRAKGCEVVCGSQKGIEIGLKIVNELVNIGFSIHRGAYIDDRGLAEIRSFHGITLICEPFFCDNSIDVGIYSRIGDEGIASAIVKGLIGKSVQNVIITSQPTQSSQSSVDKAKAFIGNRALELQQKLNRLGYKLVEDGDFGNLTYNAVIHYQSQNGLIVDGLCGTNTWNAINNSLAKINQPTPVIKPVIQTSQPQSQPKASINPYVMSIQKLCNQLELKDGQGRDLVVDGICGTNTANAISKLPVAKIFGYHNTAFTSWIESRLGLKQDGIFFIGLSNSVKDFQRKNSIEIDGKVGQITLKKMLGI